MIRSDQSDQSDRVESIMSGKTLRAFAESFPGEMQKKVVELGIQLERVTVNTLASYIDEPVLTGKLKGSRTISASDSKGASIGWTAVQSIFIDIGRVRSKMFTKRTMHGKSKPFTRMLGSDALPEGFTQPALTRLRSNWATVVELAGLAAEFDSKGGGD